MKRLGQKICVAVVLSLAFVAIWHDSAKAGMPGIVSIGQIKAGVVNPTRIDVDAAGTIYLCDASVNGVTRYNQYGQALPTLRGPYTVKANGVAVTPDGSRVFVSVGQLLPAPNPDNLYLSAVAVLDGSTGALLGYLGSGFGEFKRVVEIDLDGNGNIYVGDFDKPKSTSYLNNTAKIKIYSGTDYSAMGSFGASATTLNGTYYLPKPGEFGDIAGFMVDVANSEIFVAEAWNNNGVARVQIFGLDGTFKRLLPEAKIAGTQVNCKPSGLTVDALGRIYMLSILTSTVHVFTADSILPAGTTGTDLYLGKYTKTTPDPAYDAAGKVIPWTVGMISTPSYDTIFDPLTGRLFVVTDGNGIQVFGIDGKLNPEPPVITNSAPGTPIMIAPVQGNEVATLTPTLQWGASLDADGDPLSYNVQLVAGDGTTEVGPIKNVAATSMSVSAGTLLENKKYGWKVQAKDAVSTSPYSGIETFWVNATEEAPSAVQLLGPAAAATVNKNTVFTWSVATDVDPFDSVTYRLEIAKSTDFSAPVIIVNQSALTSAPLSTLPGYGTLQAGETYLWRVIAVDSTGLTTASDFRSFDCNSAPEMRGMVRPVGESEVATLTPTLEWEAALDADGDALSYNVQIVDAGGKAVSAINNVAATSVSVPDGILLENKKYGWQVQAADVELTSSYSVVENFWVNAVEEAPTAPALAEPLATVIVDKDTVFSWSASTDADPLNTMTYRLEIAKSIDFVDTVITVEQSELNSLPLSTLPGYGALQSGVTYQWRVVAVDSSGMSAASEVRSFKYISTILTVDATFTGAKVYIGGNNAYSGRYVGEVPLELRDVNPGTIEIVVERAGFEPWTKSVVVKTGESISVNAALVVAILPGDFNSAPLFAGGLPVQAGVEAAPVVVDFNDDGNADLLVADGGGNLHYYEGVADAKSPVLKGVQLPGVTLHAGAVPFIADWNNDDRKDLLVGAGDGSVSLYLNVGTQSLPVFAEPVQLEDKNGPLNVGSNATPVLFDLNKDGAKDLLVGSGDGSLYKFLNVGTDAAPNFAAGEVLITSTGGAVNASVVVTDWNADGNKEILLATNQGIFVCNGQTDGSYVKGSTILAINDAKTSKAANLGQKIRLASVNFDGIYGKDLLIGNAAGQILLANSTMKKTSAISSYYGAALLETVAEIESLIQSHGRMTSLVSAKLNKVKTTIQAQASNNTNYYYKATADVIYLQNSLKADAEIFALLAKLGTQLNSVIPLK